MLPLALLTSLSLLSAAPPVSEPAPGPLPAPAPPAPAVAALRSCDTAWRTRDVEQALGCLTGDVTIVFMADPPTAARPQMIPDATFKGHRGARSLLSVLLPELTLEAEEATVNGVKATSEARLQGALVRAWGLQSLRVRREVVALNGKVQHLTLAVHPEDALHLLWAIPRANKAVVHRFYEGVNRHELGLIDEVVSPDFVQHSSLPIGPGREGLREYFTRFWKAFPDAHISIDDLVAEGDRVSTRTTGRYTHKGPYLGVAPTGRSIVVTRIAIFRVWGGMILEHWDEVDRLGLLQQLGAVPTLPQWSVSPGYEGFR